MLRFRIDRIQSSIYLRSTDCSLHEIILLSYSFTRPKTTTKQRARAKFDVDSEEKPVRRWKTSTSGFSTMSLPKTIDVTGGDFIMWACQFYNYDL